MKDYILQVISVGFIAGKLLWLTRDTTDVCGCKNQSRTPDALNARHSYQVHVVGENEQVDTVSGVNAVSSIGDDVVDLIAHVDLIDTAGARWC